MPSFAIFLARTGIVRRFPDRFAGDLCHCKSVCYLGYAAPEPKARGRSGRFRANRPLFPFFSVTCGEGVAPRAGRADRNPCEVKYREVGGAVAPRAGRADRNLAGVDDETPPAESRPVRG